MISLANELAGAVRGQWNFFYPNTQTEALELLTRVPMDVMIVDIRFPDQSGIDLLTRTQKALPHVVRIAIAEQKNVVDHLRKSGLAQQFLGKNFDGPGLKSTILRALTLGDLLRHNMLQRLISQVHVLPSLPSLYLQIADELNNPDPTAERVGQIIAQDISLTAKVLQIVNSAYFGLPYQVADPAQATTLLGLEAIRDLVLSIKVFSTFDQLKIRHLGLTRLWHHSVMVGVLSRIVARAITPDKNTNNQSFVAGLLHDIGKLVLAENLPMKYHAAMGLATQKRIELYQAEEEIFGATHAQVGAYLLWLWNLPDPVITATAYHHVPAPLAPNGFSVVTTVHLANTFNYEMSTSSNKWAVPHLDIAYLTQLGIAHRLDVLRALCEKSIQESEA